VVAFAFLAVLLLGWRAVASVSSRLRGSNRSSTKPKWMQS
jgi:hypothetical protein